MIKQYGPRWNHDERVEAIDDLGVMSTRPSFVFGYIEEREGGLRVVSFFDVTGNRERLLRGQEIIDEWSFIKSN